MADNNNVNSVVDSLLKGLEGFATAKTVVGEAIHVNDTIILPLVDVSLVIGAGAALNEEKKKNNGGGGMGAKMSPSAVLLIQNGVPRLINIKNQDTVTKVLDMVPDLINRFTGKTEPVDPEAQDIIDHMGEEK